MTVDHYGYHEIVPGDTGAKLKEEYGKSPLQVYMINVNKARRKAVEDFAKTVEAELNRLLLLNEGSSYEEGIQDAIDTLKEELERYDGT